MLCRTIIERLAQATFDSDAQRAHQFVQFEDVSKIGNFVLIQTNMARETVVKLTDIGERPTQLWRVGRSGRREIGAGFSLRQTQ